MAVKFENAQLRVRTINGRNGAFCVGELQTALGDFKIKDSILDQFEEGAYEVDAWLDRIYLGQYVAYGRAVSEIRAQLVDLQVIDERRQQMPGEPEPDPIDEAEAAPAAAPAPVEAPAPTPEKNEPGRDKRWDKFNKKKQEEVSAPAESAAAAPAEAVDSAEEGEVFDEALSIVVNHHEPVKLDPTVDRALFRRQTSALKARGYRFNAREQVWYAD